jgi:N-acetylglucosaminyldiphosphoundecaprenol N-acetyl-beta-D-mannosaminyltransferase
MGVRFSHLSTEAALTTVRNHVGKKRSNRPLTVFTPNVEQLLQAVDDSQFLTTLNSADVSVPDSVGLITADWYRAFATGKAWLVRDRVTGIDLAEQICAEASIQGWKVVLIGGIGQAGELAVENLKKRFSGLRVWLAPSPVKVELETGVEFRQTLQILNQIQPDVLLVGFGAPKQERWILKHSKELPVKVVMAVGGSIDVWAGILPRAPLWLREVGLEWLWRLMVQPWRIRRQWRLVRFGWMVLRGKW